MLFSFADGCGHRRLHVALPGGLTLPVVASFPDATGLNAIRAALADAAAAFAPQLMRPEAPNRATGALESARTALVQGFRVTYWLQRTEATFAVLRVRAGSADALAPTPQTLHIVAERDPTAGEPPAAPE